MRARAHKLSGLPYLTSTKVSTKPSLLFVRKFDHFYADFTYGSGLKYLNCGRGEKKNVPLPPTTVMVTTLAVLASWSSSSSSKSPASSYDTSMVHRLLSDRDILIQDGLSYFNETSLKVLLRSIVSLSIRSFEQKDTQINVGNSQKN